MHRYLTIFLVICLCYDGISQQYPLVHYTPKDGLVNSRVRKVFQDSKGRLYFLSYGGLSVYDGNRFKNYTIQNGLAADMVNDILEVGDDSLLVAPNTDEMNLLVRGQMTKFAAVDKFSPTINYFLRCNNGNIYVTADQGLFMLKGNKFEKIDIAIPNTIDAPFLGVVTDWNESLIFSTNDLRRNKGLFVFNKKTLRLTDMMPDSIIGFLEKDKQGSIWISTNKGIYNLDTISLKNGKLKFLKPFNGYQHIGAYSTPLLAFEENRVWLIDKMKNLIKTNADGTSLKINLEDQFPGAIGSLFIDKEKIAWICTAQNGVVKLTGTNLTIAPLLSANNNAYVIHRATYVNDTTWFVVNSDKLVRKSNSGIQTFTTNIGSEIHLIEQRMGKLTVADDNYIYQASVPSKEQSYINFKVSFATPKGMTLAVEHLLDKDGNLYISTNKSLSVIQGNKLVFQFPIGPTDAVQAIRMDSVGRLWLTTRSLGLVVFNVHPNDPEHFLEQVFRFQKDMTKISPRSMVIDKNGIIWIGTRFNGVSAFKFDGTNLIPIYQFQVQQGLTDNFITSLACDSSNNILAGSPTGLDRLIAISDSEYRIENITKSNNIFGGFFEDIWVDHNKVIHGIMGNNALLQFSPVTLNKPYTPQLFIEEVKVNGQPYSYFASNSFSYNQRNISLTLAAPAFLNERQVQYTYRLRGTDNDQWSEPSTNANINLINLSSGDYKLDVKAFFPSTPYASQQLTYHFIITPPWWESWVFRIIGAIVLIGIVYFIVRFYYRRKMEKQRITLEKQKAIEIERTRIAHDIHDDLGAGLSTIRFLSEKVKLDPSSENTKTDIDKMQSTSYDLMEKMNEIIWAMNEKNDTLEDLLFYTRAYAKEYCEENDLQCSFDIPENIPLMFVSGEVRRNVFLAVKESLHNIVKHAFASEVRIQISIDKSLCIKVQDNGRGLEAKSFTLNGGNGLQIMQKRMGSIGGSLSITYENGTSVEMEVPLK